MKTSKASWIVGVAAVLVLSFGFSIPLRAQSADPIPGVGTAKDVPGAHELPDPSLTYKILLRISRGAEKVDEINPGLRWASQFFNTLVKYGVPADHLKIAVLLAGQATPSLMNNEAFKARFDGHDNPNIALIQNMKKAGVNVQVCGQSVLNNKIDPKTLLPEVELDLWALTTRANMTLRGYVELEEPAGR